MTITIDDMAKAGCTTARGIRYWEGEGLFGEVQRTPGKQRRYTETQLDRARIIAACQFGGWDLEKAKLMVENYDREVYDALQSRLLAQVQVATQISENLPMPADKPELDYDL